MTEVLLVALGRLLATAVLIVIVARVAERAGPFVASTILTLPLFAGPSYFFLLFELPGEFIAASALYAFAGTGAVLAFTAGFVLMVMRFGLLSALVAGSAMWLLVTLPMRATVMNLPIALAFCAVGVVLAWLLRRPVDLHARPAAGRAGWQSLWLRAMVAGMAVAAVSLAGAALGPELTGIAVSFPLTLSVSAWLVYRQYGAPFAAAMLTATQRTLPSYAMFCLGLHLFESITGIGYAFALALAASVCSAAMLALVGMRSSARTRQQQAS